MIYGSVCSGIEAATVAWHPLGWRAAFFAEIDKFPSAVLAHRYPHTHNLGDFTAITPEQHEPIDILVGGTPCQSFSIAGLRGGLADDRGNLALEYLRLAQRSRPRWLVWENVPGVLSSSGGRDFGAILGGLVELGYGFAYRILDAQYVRVDGFRRAVPQRRRRVFVVGYLGDWRRAAAVLFERASLRGDSAPRREAGEGIAHDVAPCIGASGRGFERAGDTRGQDCVIASTGNVAHCLNAGGMGRIDYETETMVAHALRADGFDASEDGTGRGTPIIPIPFDTTQITSKGNYSVPEAGDPCHPLAAGSHPPAIAFDSKASGRNGFAIGEISPTLRSMAHKNSHQNGGGQVAVAIATHDVAGTMMSYAKSGGDSNRIDNAAAGYMAIDPQTWKVRRLTVEECERLQGFPDGYTNIPWRGKDHAPDGPRYKALGNSMAVNVMRWIGRRIEMVEAISEKANAA